MSNHGRNYASGSFSINNSNIISFNQINPYSSQSYESINPGSSTQSSTSHSNSISMLLTLNFLFFVLIF